MQVPVAPFLALSFGAGVFALLPYFALWAPLRETEQTLPPKSELVRPDSTSMMLNRELVKAKSWASWV